MRRCIAMAVLFVAGGAIASGQTPQPAGPEFLVNGYTTSDQSQPHVAVEPDGDFVIVWSSWYQDGSERGVFARRYAADTSPRGAEFRVNTYTTGHQVSANVAVGANGAFDVVWTSVQDGSATSVHGQRYDGSGSPVGGEFQVNTYTTSYQYAPRIARAADGRFVVSWSSGLQDGSSTGIAARRFDASGNPLGSDFIVNSYTTAVQDGTSIASDANGNFVVVWTDESGLDGSDMGVFGQRFGSAGNRLGGEFQVNTYTPQDQQRPSVSVSPLGGFAVAFTSRTAEGGIYTIKARRFDAAGNGVGSDFMVNTYTEGAQATTARSISHDAAGNFVVTWERQQFPYDVGQILAQRFDASGNRMGTQFTVNQYTPDSQQNATVASDAAGNFVVTWREFVPPLETDVFARRFHATWIEPAALAVDPVATSSSNGNGLQEPGEEVQVRPTWRNSLPAAQTFTGTIDRATGPAGATHVITDASADYGTIAPGATGACAECYAFSVSDPAARPAVHWDASVTETTSTVVAEKEWIIHVGRSFTDVATASPFYRFIETLLHKSVTGGCSATEYCPASSTTREQMAVFVLVAKTGPAYTPPGCSSPMFADVPTTSPFCPWIQELALRGVVAGCSAGNYCPSAAVTRDQMAVFVLRTLDPTLNPPLCTTPLYNDVSASNPFCRWIEELTRRGVVTGCSPGNYCPAAAVTREQMGVFLSATFGLVLYGS